MKLERRTFGIFWDVHAWAGVLSALLLYVMFFAAPFALFHAELNEWAERGSAMSGPVPPLQPLLEQLEREQPRLREGRVSFSLRGQTLRAETNNGLEKRVFRLEPATHELVPTSTELGSFLYELHYLGSIPGGIYVAGVASMALALTLVTGFLIQLKDLTRQWFQFRPQHLTRTWSSDLHKLLGVLGLPFQVFFAWSGAVLCLGWVSVEPAFRATVFRGNESALSAARGIVPSSTLSQERSARPPNIDALLRRAGQAVPGLEPEWIGLEQLDEPASSARIYGKIPGVAFGSVAVVLGAQNAVLQSVSTPRSATALQRFEAWFFGLHYARFGGAGVKALYALLAFATCAVLVTGNVIWLERRERTRQLLGNRLLLRLTVAVAVGLPVATGALFLINRALPGQVEQAASTELRVFWATWLVAALCALASARSRLVAARGLLVAAALFAAAFGLDLIQRKNTPNYLDYWGVPSTLAALAAASSAIGLALRRVRAATPRAASPARQAEPIS